MSLSSEIGYLINIFEYLMNEIGNGRQLWQAMHLIGSCPFHAPALIRIIKPMRGVALKHLD